MVSAVRVAGRYIRKVAHPRPSPEVARDTDATLKTIAQFMKGQGWRYTKLSKHSAMFEMTWIKGTNVIGNQDYGQWSLTVSGWHGQGSYNDSDRVIFGVLLMKIHDAVEEWKADFHPFDPDPKASVKTPAEIKLLIGWNHTALEKVKAFSAKVPLAR